MIYRNLVAERFSQFPLQPDDTSRELIDSIQNDKEQDEEDAEHDNENGHNSHNDASLIKGCRTAVCASGRKLLDARPVVCK